MIIGLITALFVICGGLTLAYIILFFTDYHSHISMTKKNSTIYDYTDFKTFIREFNKSLNGEHTIHNDGFKGSIFIKKYIGKDKTFKYDSVYLHAGIIRFEKRGMILYPLSYIRYLLWKKKFTEENLNSHKRIKGLFNENLKDKEK